MVKKIRKALAICLAIVLCMSLIPATIFADGTTVETDENGLTVTTTTNTATETDEDGNVTVTITIDKKTEGTTADGVVVDREESRTEKTVTDSEGNEIGSTFTDEGSEKKMWEEQPAADQELPEISLGLTPGEEVNTTVQGKIETTDPETGEKKTVTTDREASASASEGKTTVTIGGTSELTPLTPDRTIDDDGDLKDEQLLKEYTYSGGFEDYPEVVAPDGYDYRFTGFGQMSKFGNAIVNGNGSKGVTGALQFEVQYDPDYDPNSDSNKVITEKDIFTAYCADINTDGKDNFWYRLDSLEDAGYYDEESAEYIRAIAFNGYWGTSNEPDSEGNYQMGSLAKLKKDMKAALQAGLLTGITEEEIDSITEGQALNATQSAIWMYANATTEGSIVDTEKLIGKGFAKNKSERVEPTEQERKNVSAVFNYLMGLEPVEKQGAVEVIDNDAFIKEGSLGLIIGDKLAEHAANIDDDNSNDVYNVSLEFALVVTPSDDKDDLLVQIVSGIDADGNPIVVATGRIAGGNADEDAANGISRVTFDEESGTYTLSDLKLAENSDFNFDLRLVGTQYLEKGVYIFTSEARGTDKNGNGVLDEDEKVTSQTFVTVLEGDKEVDVTRSYSISFNVDETNSVVTERVWDEEGDPIEMPDNIEGEEDTDGPLNELPEEDDDEHKVTIKKNEAETILDEEVPLAAAPKTGDYTFVLIAISAVIAIALALTFVFEKKRRAEKAAKH